MVICPVKLEEIESKNRGDTSDAIPDQFGIAAAFCAGINKSTIPKLA